MVLCSRCGEDKGKKRFTPGELKKQENAVCRDCQKLQQLPQQHLTDAKTQSGPKSQHDPAKPSHPTYIQQELDPCKSMQDEEMEALEAIYLDDYKRLPDMWDSPCVSIKLRTSLDEDDDSPPTVTLMFTLPPCYPTIQCPNIELQGPENIPEERLEELEKMLSASSKSKIGNVMIHDLVMEAQEMLVSHHTKQHSFYEQMMLRMEQMKKEEEVIHDELSAQDKAQALKEESLLQKAIVAERERAEAHARAHKLGKSQHHKNSGENELDMHERVDGELWNEPSSDESDDERHLDEKRWGGSRYHTDFKELEQLGRGGFGEVVKVQNRLDKRLYAVKKIKLDPADVMNKRKILREVTYISRLSHRHIVRYYQAWLEGGSEDSQDASFSESDDDWLERSDNETEPRDDEDWFGASTSRSIGQLQKTPNRNTLDSCSQLPPLPVSTDDTADGDEDDSTEASESAEDDEDEDDEFNQLEQYSGNDIDEDLWMSKKGNGGSHDEAIHNQWNQWNIETGSLSDTTKEVDVNDFFFQVASSAPSPKGHQKSEVPRKSNHEKKSTECLYIQMEFCEGKTLREVIDKGDLWKNHEGVWRFFRQIVEAIAYIHDKGMIHRDIKPSNVFFDGEGSVKLGDFGLATRRNRDEVESDNEQDSPRNSLPPESQHIELSLGKSGNTMALESITAGVGTAFYRAPEQEQEGSKYNQKADMFSLGVIFFEMWNPPFTTGMERAETLSELRQRDALPESFVKRLPPNAADIILWLCNTNPNARPTAMELLTSNLMPPKMEVEEMYLKEALQTLANPQGTFFQNLIDALFVQAPRDHVDYTYDSLLASRKKSSESELRARTAVCSLMQDVFERHGAIHQSTPLLRPRLYARGGNIDASSINSFSLMDGQGVCVNLPYDLTEPLARYAARNGVSHMKCYQFDRVYRKTMGGGHPRELYEADFDIIWDMAKGAEIVQAEVLMVLTEVFRSIGPQLGPYYLRINNTKMVNGILNLCNINVSNRADLLKLLSESCRAQVEYNPNLRTVQSTSSVLHSNRWKIVRKELLNLPLSPVVADFLRPLFFLPLDPLACLDAIEQSLSQNPFSLEQVLGAKSLRKSEQNLPRSYRRNSNPRYWLEHAQEGIGNLRACISKLNELNIAGPSFVLIDLGLVQKQENYNSGLFFQAVLLPTASVGFEGLKGGRDTLAEGGQYDHLIQRYRLPAARISAPSVVAVGLRFAVDKIVASVLAEVNEPSSLDLVRNGGADVLICSPGRGTDLLQQRLQIARTLWTSRIKAEYMHPDITSIDKLDELCVSQGISWVVLVFPHLLVQKRAVKVRAVRMPDKPDRLVSLPSLAQFLLEEANLGHEAHGVFSRLPLPTTPSGKAISRPIVPQSSSTLVDVEVLELKGTKEKKKTKDLDMMIHRVEKWAETLGAGANGKPMPALILEVPYLLIREVSTQYQLHGAAGYEDLMERNPRYRRPLKAVLERLEEMAAAFSNRQKQVRRVLLLYSSIDDRYDLVYVNHSGRGSPTLASGNTNGKKRRGVPPTPPKLRKGYG